MTKRRLASYGLNLVGVALLYAAITLAFTFNAFGKSTTYIQGICTTACYTIIMVTSLNLVVGFMGEFSMGHAGFVSVGAYVSAIVSGALAGHGLSDLALLLVAILAGGLAAGLMGIAVGIPALRLRGDYLAIVTMAFAEIIRVCFCNFSITGGGKTMSGILKLSTFDRAFWIMVVCVTVMFLFVRSRPRGLHCGVGLGHQRDLLQGTDLCGLGVLCGRRRQRLRPLHDRDDPHKLQLQLFGRAAL